MKNLKRVNLAKIEGIGTAYASKLHGLGVNTVASLLEAAANRQGREKLAEKLGISEKLILEWTNHADLMRLKGVGEEYSDLLEAAGVDSPLELANRNPSNLHQKIVEVNTSKNVVRRVPSLRQVEGWVKEAKTLSRIVSH